MNIIENLPISKLINTINKTLNITKNANIKFSDLKKELMKKDKHGNQYYSLNIKENDDLAIIYYVNGGSNKKNNFSSILENSCYSIIMEKSSLKIIVSQFNKILCNKNAIEYIKSKDWSNVAIYDCYEGIKFIVFYHNNKWYVSTQKCIDLNDSYRDMFDDTMNGKFKFDDLDKNYCYHFILLHHKNKNIVNYNTYGDEYKELCHIFTTEKYTLNEVDFKINNTIILNEKNFKSIDELLFNLESIDQQNKFEKKITTEGYMLKVYDGEKYKSNFKIAKIQTDIYKYLLKTKPNNTNINQNYLELYQKNKLADYLPYFSNFSTEIIKRIHTSMRNIAKEILDLYHCTRQKKNNHIYNNLSENYKKILYGIHGLYIQNRKTDFGDSYFDKSKLSKSINVHDVYYHLKNLDPNELRLIYLERNKLLENEKNTFLNKNCIYTKTQTALMFKNIT